MQLTVNALDTLLILKQMTNKLNESVAQRVFKTLLERFGEPIVDPKQTIGMRDERKQVRDEEDTIDDKLWSEYQKQPSKVVESNKAHQHTAECAANCNEDDRPKYSQLTCPRWHAPTKMRKEKDGYRCPRCKFFVSKDEKVYDTIDEAYVKPPYKGRSVGQSWTTNDHVGYRKVWIKDKETGKDRLIRVPQMKKITLVWDGNDWITEHEFNLKAAHSPAAKPGGKENVADFLRRGGKIKRVG